MKNHNPILFNLFLLIACCSLLWVQCKPAKQNIFESKVFAVSQNSVEQGEYFAKALSPTHIISNYNNPKTDEIKRIERSWKLDTDLSNFPSFKSNQVLMEALYNLSLEEVVKNTTSEGLFDTGAQWKGVWTRDISYSILLALAITHPEISKASLMKKVKGGVIIQDTGTGGSWPVSSDRMAWTLAAWEVYKVTGDRTWLRTAFDIIKRSTDDDLNVVWDYKYHLFKGESSFLDWREQSYPIWMQPLDIYNSMNLGTQAVHFQNLIILSQMGKLLGHDTQKYEHIAQALNKSINEKFWIPEKAYYGQYLYGRNHYNLSDKSESLGEALTVLFNIAPPERQKEVIENTPVLDFGIPCFYPQIPNIKPYHNNAIWPFVQAYWNWAAAKTGNEQALAHGMASMLRQSALFLTNKENMVGSSGDFEGTAINSDRQLWSVAGNLSTVYRILFGMHFRADSLLFSPFVPIGFKGTQRLKNIKYRKANLNIEVIGFGNQIRSFTLDGKYLDKAVIPSSLEGTHKVVIEMANTQPKRSKFNLVVNRTAPETPIVHFKNNQLSWNPIEGALKHIVYKNGKKLAETKQNIYPTTLPFQPTEYQVMSIDSTGLSSFLSKPVIVMDSQFEQVLEAERFASQSSLKSENYTGNGYIMLSKSENRVFDFKVRASRTARYRINFRYANGSGPINTDNKCAIRTLWVNGNFQGVVIFPQRGTDAWNKWGSSNAFEINMIKGMNNISLTYEHYNENMNRKVNRALLDHIHVVRLSQ